MPARKLTIDSVCVAASYIDNFGRVEYRGIDTKTSESIFHVPAILNSTTNLGDFFAIVHALFYLKNQDSNLPIYSNSETAIWWVKNRNLEIELKRSKDNIKIFELVERALKWLENNDYTNAVLKWNTQSWGKNPASFSRKQNLSNQFQLIRSQLEVPETKTASAELQLIEQPLYISISGNTYPFREKLKKFGLSWSCERWEGTFLPSMIEKLKQFCRRHDLQYTIKKDGRKIESSLSRGARSLPSSTTAAVMGEGKLQWEIEEIAYVERLRNKQHKYKSQDKKN